MSDKEATAKKRVAIAADSKESKANTETSAKDK